MATLLVAEHDNKSLKDATAKALSAAKAIGPEVHILVAGKDCRPAAEAAAKLAGVAKVLVAGGAPYEHMLAEPMAALIVALAPGYDTIIAPATPMVNDDTANARSLALSRRMPMSSAAMSMSRTAIHMRPIRPCTMFEAIQAIAATMVKTTR